MSELAERIRRALTDNRAETSADAADPRLRGRTYGVPFEEVWRAALRLIETRRGWHLVSADDETGQIVTEATSPLFRLTDDVEIDIRLDEDAQTRVDMRSASRTRRTDFGANARRIRSFCGALDEELSGWTPHGRRTGEGPPEAASA